MSDIGSTSHNPDMPSLRPHPKPSEKALLNKVQASVGKIESICKGFSELHVNLKIHLIFEMSLAKSNMTLQRIVMRLLT